MKNTKLITLLGVSAIATVLLTASSRVTKPGDTKPFKETNVEIFSQDVLPGSFLHPEFEAVRENRGRLEDGAAVTALASNSNIGGKGTRFATIIYYVDVDSEGSIVLDYYSLNTCVVADGSSFDAWAGPGFKVYQTGPKAGTYEAEWIVVGGTGRFEGITGQGTLAGTFGEDQLNQYVAVGEVSTVGSLKKTR